MSACVSEYAVARERARCTLQKCGTANATSAAPSTSAARIAERAANTRHVSSWRGVKQRCSMLSATGNVKRALVNSKSTVSDAFTISFTIQ